jgi:hypothetical protein
LPEFAVPVGIHEVAECGGGSDGSDDREEEADTGDAVFTFEFFFLVGAGVRLEFVEFVAALAGCLGETPVAGWCPVFDLVGVVFAGEAVVGWEEAWDETAAAVALDFVVVVTNDLVRV